MVTQPDHCMSPSPQQDQMAENTGLWIKAEQAAMRMAHQTEDRKILKIHTVNQEKAYVPRAQSLPTLGWLGSQTKDS